MQLLGVADKNNFTVVTGPQIKINLWFNKSNGKLVYYSIHVEHKRISNVALVNQHGAVDFVANDKNVIAFSQDVDQDAYGIFFQTKDSSESTLFNNFVLKIESDKVYLITVDSQFDVPLLFTKFLGSKAPHFNAGIQSRFS